MVALDATIVTVALPSTSTNLGFGSQTQSLVNRLAQNPSTLIVGRVAQGLGGALVSPAVLSIIIVTFESVGDRAKALGSFSAITASGSADHRGVAGGAERPPPGRGADFSSITGRSVT